MALLVTNSLAGSSMIEIGSRRTIGSAPVSIVLVAGTVAAVVEMIPILAIQGLLLGVTSARIFQSIASGLLGRAAYSGGSATVVLGAALHLLISVIAAAVFVVAAQRRPSLLRRPLSSGLAFGVLAYVVMSWIVVPLSAVAFKPAFDPALMAVSLAVHMLFFGLPIAFTARWLTQRSGG